MIAVVEEVMLLEKQYDEKLPKKGASAEKNEPQVSGDLVSTCVEWGRGAGRIAGVGPTFWDPLYGRERQSSKGAGRPIRSVECVRECWWSGTSKPKITEILRFISYLTEK